MSKTTSDEATGDLSLRQTIAADLARVAGIKGATRLTVPAAIDALALPGSCAVLLFRLAAAARRAGLKPVGRMLYFLNVVLFGAALHPAARVGPGLVIAHPTGVGWGKYFVCGRNATMTAGVRFGGSGSEEPHRVGHPTVGDDVYLLDGAKAMGPVTIGDRAIVAANTLVLKDVPANAVVVGSPARIAKMRSERYERDPGATVLAEVANLDAS